jgi:TPR repeat protein
MRKTTLAILFFVVMICTNCTWRTLPVQAGKEFEEGRAAYERGDYATAIKNAMNAIKKLRSLAEAGNAEAQFYLGAMYAKGHGVPQDAKEAAKWYRKAAEQGVAEAQAALGEMYEKGLGVPQNKIVAYALYNLAAANSSKVATSYRNTLLDKMTPREIEVGQGTG